MQAYQQLQNLYQYLKKAVNTKLTCELLKEKEKLNNKLKLEIEQVLQVECHRIEDKEFHQIVKNTRYWNAEIQRIINHKLEILQLHTTIHKTSQIHSLGGIAKTTITCEHAPKVLSKTLFKNKDKSNSSRDSSIMPGDTMAFNLKDATALIPSFDGSASNLPSFIDAVNLLAELTPESQVATAIKFIKIKLTGKARQGLPANINTFDDLIADIQRRCKSKETPKSLEAKFNQLNPANKNEFCDAVENITQDLKSLYLDQGVPTDTANSLATTAGLNALIEKIHCRDTQLILKAGNFTDIQSATQKVRQYVNNNPTTANNIFMTQHRNHRQGRGRGGRYDANISSTPIRGANRQIPWRNNFNNFRNNNSFHTNNRFSHSNFRGRGHYSSYPPSRANFNFRGGYMQKFAYPNQRTNLNRMYIANADLPMNQQQQIQMRTTNAQNADVVARQQQVPIVSFPNENFLGGPY